MGATRYLTYVTPGTLWLANTTYSLNQIINSNNNVYFVSTAGTSGTVPPTHTSGAVIATGGTAVLTYLQAAPSLNTEQTNIILNYNTTAMNATDKLQVVVDDFVEKFEPAETQETEKKKVSEAKKREKTRKSALDKLKELGLTPAELKELFGE